jgi:hypothetical protein
LEAVSWAVVVAVRALAMRVVVAPEVPVVSVVPLVPVGAEMTDMTGMAIVTVPRCPDLVPCQVAMR